MSEIDDIVLVGDPVLRQECEPITKIDADVRALADHMLECMYAAEGCGLAAPQVGESVQLVVIDVDYNPEKGGSRNPYVLINPKILVADGEEASYPEGCLSFPGITVDVVRPTHVVVQAYNLEGKLMQYEAEGNLMAVCLQHEIDHLHGVTMVDHLGPIARARAIHESEVAISRGAQPGQTSADDE